MAIRVKYDPVGSIGLAAYGIGAGNAQEKRRLELERRIQRATEMYQTSQDRMLNRTARVGAGNKVINIGPVNGAPAAGAVGGVDLSIYEQGKADRKSAYLAGKAARRDAYRAGKRARADAAGNDLYSTQKERRDQNTNQRLRDLGRPDLSGWVAPPFPAPGESRDGVVGEVFYVDAAGKRVDQPVPGGAAWKIETNGITNVPMPGPAAPVPPVVPGAAAPAPPVVPGAVAPAADVVPPVISRPRMPHMDIDPATGLGYVDADELKTYLGGIKETVNEKLPAYEADILEPETVREYSGHVDEVKKILRGRTAADPNRPESWEAIEKHLEAMDGIRRSARKSLEEQQNKEAKAVEQQQAIESQTAVTQAKAAEDQARVTADIETQKQDQQKRTDARAKLEEDKFKGELDAIANHPTMTPEQKAAKSKAAVDARIVDMDRKEESKRRSMQLRLDALNIIVAEGGTLTPSQEAKRDEYARLLDTHNTGADLVDMPPGPMGTTQPAVETTPTTAPIDLNQELVDSIIEEEQIRQRYGIIGPIGPAMRAYHAMQLSREQRIIDDNAALYAGHALHTTGALEGLPVAGPGGRHYKEGTEFARDKKGRVLYRSGGIPMVTRGYNTVDEPVKPLGTVGSYSKPETPTPARGRGEIDIDPETGGRFLTDQEVGDALGQLGDSELGTRRSNMQRRTLDRRSGAYLDPATGNPKTRPAKIVNAPSPEAAKLADQYLPHPKTAAEAKALGSGALFIDPHGMIRRVP